MSKLITSHYPPVSGNVCDAFVATDSECKPVRFEWSDGLERFMIAGTSIDVTYGHLEKNYELFIWKCDK